MKTLKYNILLLTIICIAAFAGCKGKSADVHAADSHEGHDHSVKEAQVHTEGEAEGEHEELPEDIVELNADQIILAGIQMGNVQLRSVNGVLKANGLVSTAPQNTASVSVPLGGFVKSSNLLPGNFVKKGQLLAVIENTEFVDLQQSCLEIRNKFEFAEAEYNRHKELYKEDVYSQKNMQQSTSEYKNLKAQLRGIEQKLSVIGINPASLTEDRISATISLVSPISGYIKTVNVSMGKYVSPTDVLFEIVNTDKLLLELTLFEKDANSIKAGQIAHFSINNESHEHQAVIYQVGKSVNTDKTYKVYATVQQSCPNVLPGMYVLAHIDKTDDAVSAVPADALVSFDNKHYIFAFERDKEESGKPFTEYRFIEVNKGNTNDGFTEIQLPANFDLKNARIVIKGAYILLSAKKNAGEMTCG